MSQSLQEIIKKEYQKCYTDSVYFIKKYCYIQHPERGKILFELFDFQEDALHLFEKHNRNIVLKSRQLGISTLVAAHCLHLMLFNSDKNILVIAIDQNTSKNLVTKVRVMHQNLPIWLRGKVIEDNKLSLRFANGSQIKAVASTATSGRSEALSLLVLDEAAFVENAEALWTSAQQTLATGGSAIILSTPNGFGNFFHKTWTAAEKGENEYNTIQLKWNVHPERDQAWRDKQDKELGETMAAQECDADFISSGHNVVDPAILKFYEDTHMKEPKEKRGVDQNLWLWDYPVKGHGYIVSADVARGDGADYSAAQVIDLETLEQVAEYNGKLDTKDFGNLLVNLATEYNDALLVIENAGLGWGTIQAVLDRNYKNLYYSQKEIKVVDDNSRFAKMYDRKQKSDMVAGFTTSVATRPLIIEKLVECTRDIDLKIHSKRLIDQLYTFQYVHGKAKAIESYNDDIVLAMCIGLWIRDTAYQLYKKGIEMHRQTVQNIYVSRPFANFNPSNEKIRTDQWSMDVGHPKEKREDLTWLLDK